MATVYFVVVNKKAHPSDARLNQKGAVTSEVVGPIESAEVLKIELTGTETVAHAQEVARELYPEHCTQTPIVVTEAQWKTS